MSTWHLIALLLIAMAIIVAWLYLLWECCKEHGARGRASVVPSPALVAWVERRRLQLSDESRQRAR
jgi:hypothetical protein